jgi:hypothetical protein
VDSDVVLEVKSVMHILYISVVWCCRYRGAGGKEALPLKVGLEG